MAQVFLDKFAQEISSLLVDRENNLAVQSSEIYHTVFGTVSDLKPED